MQVRIKATPVFRRIASSDKRFIVLQGGTRSSKTYSTLQWIILVYCQQNQNKVVTIARKTFPTLRMTAMRDFIEILVRSNLYNVSLHDRTNHTYNLNGNLIEFVGLDQPQKKRGAKRDLLFMNEANEFSFEDYFQLNTRTSERVILDFNPSEKFWAHEKLIGQDNVEFIKSTYLDNPFLEPALIAEIERMKLIDPDYWRVYGLGELGIPREAVYPYWNTCPEPRGERVAVGMDFGFANDPTAIVELWRDGDDLILHERLYRTGLTNPDIYREIKSIYDTERVTIVADSAEPKSIEELRRMGATIIAAKKAQGSVSAGIDLLRRYRLNVTQASPNIRRELESYRYKTDNMGNITNDVVDANNHALDAARYAALHFLARPNIGKYLVGGVAPRK